MFATWVCYLKCKLPSVLNYYWNKEVLFLIHTTLVVAVVVLVAVVFYVVIFVSFLAETLAIVECQKCLKWNSSMVNKIFFPGGSGDLKSAHWNPETCEIQAFWRLDFKWSGFSYGYSYSPNHSKLRHFCPDFKWFLATWRPIVRI